MKIVLDFDEMCEAIKYYLAYAKNLNVEGTTVSIAYEDGEDTEDEDGVDFYATLDGISL